ncbi:MAG: hypothetical protein Q9196_001785 [Gyalolechia fulgens]
MWRRLQPALLKANYIARKLHVSLLHLSPPKQRVIQQTPATPNPEGSGSTTLALCRQRWGIISRRPLSVKPNQATVRRRSAYASNFLFFASLALSKIAVLILLRQITPVISHRRLALAMGGVITVYTCAYLFANAFQCDFHLRKLSASKSTSNGSRSHCLQATDTCPTAGTATEERSAREKIREAEAAAYTRLGAMGVQNTATAEASSAPGDWDVDSDTSQTKIIKTREWRVDYNRN